MSVNSRKIIGLCGYAGVGKDEAAKALVADGWTRVAFADALRESLLALDPFVVTWADPSQHMPLSVIVKERGWELAKHTEPEVRRLLQRLGTEAGRNIHGEDCWVNIALRKIRAIDTSVVVTDVRFPNEVQAIRRYGGKIIRIHRRGVGPINNHVSDAGIARIEPDWNISNDLDVPALHALIRRYCVYGHV